MHLAVLAGQLSARIVDQRRVVELAVLIALVNGSADESDPVGRSTLGKEFG